MIIAIEEARSKLIALRKTVADLGVAFRIDELKDKSEELEAQTLAENFWNDAAASSKVLQTIKQMKDKIELHDSLSRRLEDAVALCDMAIEENDESVTDEIKAEWAKAILESQNAAPDAISGATLTFSAGSVQEAVTEILDKANGK